MTTQNKSVRICDACNWYDSYPEDPPGVGKCRFPDKVYSTKRKPFLDGVSANSSCRYGLFDEEIEAGFTREEIAEIVNRAPETLRGKVTAEDISPRFGLILKNS